MVSTYPSEKYELVKVSWDDENPNILKLLINKKTCSKPPNSIGF